MLWRLNKLISCVTFKTVLGYVMNQHFGTNEQATGMWGVAEEQRSRPSDKESVEWQNFATGGHFRGNHL